MQLARYGVSKTFYFVLEEPATTSSDRFVNAAGIFAAGDVKISKDGGALANVTNLPTQISAQLYGIVLTAAEMEADDINVLIVDAAGTVWRDALIQITTRQDTGRVIRTKKAQAGAASTITLDAAASAVNDFYNETVVSLIGGTGVGQVRVITDYVGATKVATVNRAWATNPDATSIFQVSGGADVWDSLENTEPSNANIIATNHTFRVMVQALYRRFYNLVTQTTTQQKVFADDSVTTVATMAVADDTVTQSKGKAT